MIHSEIEKKSQKFFLFGGKVVSLHTIGFGSDLGMEKYLDIVSPLAGFHPDLIVMVCSIRALKLHGGVKFEDLSIPNVEAMVDGHAESC